MDMKLLALTAGEFSASMKQFRLELGGTPLALQVGMTLPELALSAGGNIPPVVLGDISLQADLGGTKTSSFAVKGIRCDGHEIGKIAGTLQPDMRNGLYGLKAEIETLGVRSTLAASFLQSGRVFDASFRIPEQNLAKEIDLGTYVPALQSFVLASATFQADCVYRWTPEGHRGGAKLLLSKVNAVSEEKKFRLADASLRFTLPNLPELRSGAGQSFRFKALRLDNLNFDSANVLFRMESPTVWQLEGATFNWCGGKIRLGSARIAPATERFSSIMFCDRVRLGALLAQFGIGSDAGDNAALNGVAERVKIDLSDLLHFQAVMHPLLHVDPLERDASETFAACTGDTSLAILEAAIRRAGKHPSLMNREEKKDFIRILDEEGAFLIKGVVQHVAKEMQVSIYTVYNYMRQIKKDNG